MNVFIKLYFQHLLASTPKPSFKRDAKARVGTNSVAHVGTNSAAYSYTFSFEDKKYYLQARNRHLGDQVHFSVSVVSQLRANTLHYSHLRLLEQVDR